MNNKITASIICLGLLGSTILFLVSSVSAASIFSDGFESGNLTAWSSNSGSPTVTSTADGVYSGTYGLNLTSSSTQLASKTFTANSTFYTEFYVKFQNLPSADTRRLNLMEYKPSTGGYPVAYVYNDAGTVHWSLDSNSATNRTGPTPTTNTWYRVTFVVISGTGAYLYVDGSLAVVGTMQTATFSQIDVGGWGRSETLTHYMDDFKVDNQNDPYVPPATPTPTPTPPPSWGYGFAGIPNDQIGSIGGIAKTSISKVAGIP